MSVSSILLIVAAGVALGAICRQILESSGGAYSLANFLLKKFGPGRAPSAMMLTGFIVAIPDSSMLVS